MIDMVIAVTYEVLERLFNKCEAVGSIHPDGGQATLVYIDWGGPSTPVWKDRGGPSTPVWNHPSVHGPRGPSQGGSIHPTTPVPSERAMHTIYSI